MPSKGKRVASRQNNLRRRRGGPSRAAPARNPAAAAPAAAAVAEPEAERPAQAAAATATATVASPTQSRAESAIGRPSTGGRGRRFDRPAAYNYVGSELRRIGIFSGVLVVVLVAVSFVI